ncbi:uncharacterized GPI-anchored protein At3g06035-like isoform X1 [Momordica charantia]|uniref:Uncharacterized GPI-anchored protein At3g06035-like isoform X1 n=1 Tax=Momordica charantia TaxID=3673 RepID=A0A6J1CC33_MOMCH|nr:uncharacterized GPI-anchored protein At3g06035-like isoform X1 [Momordica charantia]
MANSRLCFLLPLLLACVFVSNRPAKCDDEDDLHRGINSYRAILNLTALTENDNADCLAEEIADKLKHQPCTNTTGSNAVAGTEPQFPDFPNLLAKCHLNISNTRDGAIMPACVPNRVPDLVLANFTKSQYSGNLNDTKYTGIGIGTEDDWVVVILTTSTPEGSYVTAAKNTATLVSKIGLFSQLLFLMLSFVSLL